MLDLVDSLPLRALFSFLSGLVAGVVALTVYSPLRNARRRRAVDAATSEHRIALDFIADEQCSMPHEFAACWLDGNHAAIERKFPEFRHFRTARLDEIAYAEYAQ